MKKLFSLVCAVFVTVMTFGASYGILVNGKTYYAGAEAGQNEGFTQYLAHVPVQAGDYCQLYDADNKVSWAVTLNQYSVDGFTLNNDRYEVSVTGCYDFYIKLKYGSDELYIGNGSNCGDGEDISGGNTPDFTKPYTLTFTYCDKVDGDGSAKLTTVEAIFAEASRAYVAKVDTGIQVYAGRKYKEGNDSIFSNLKLGSASAAGELKFSLATATEVDSIVFRAAMYAAAEGGDGFKVNGDNFTLAAGKLAFEDKVWTPEGEVTTIDLVQNKASKGRFFLTSITIYPKSGETPEPPTPAEKDSIYFVNTLNWATPTVHLWGGTAQGTTWPGAALTEKEAEKINGFDVYKYVADKGAYVNCVFSNNGAEEGKTADQVWTSGKYFYKNAWYAKEDIPALTPDPKFYVTGDTALVVDAGVAADKAWKADAIKSMKDTLALNLKAGKEYKLKLIEDGNWEGGKVYGFDKLTKEIKGLSGDNDGNIVFQLAEDGEVKVIYFWTEVSAENWEMTFVLEGNFYVKPVEPTAKFYVTGDTALVVDAGVAADKAWKADAIKSMKDTLSLNLKAGKEYKLKLIEDGNWDGGKVYGFDKLTKEIKGLSGDNDGNIVFQLAEDGEVKVIYFWTEVSAENWEMTFVLEGKFYVKPVEPTAKFYVTGDTALVVDAGVAADKAWKADAIKSMKDTLALNLKAGKEYKLKLIEDGNWEGGKVYGFDKLTKEIKGLSGDNDGNIVFQLAEDGEVKVIYFWTEVSAENWEMTFVLEGKFYVKPAPVLPNGFYLLGSLNNWTPAAAYQFAATEVEGEYKLNTTLTVGDQIKPAYVEDDAAKTWYGENDYTVDADHAGAVTIYFRPVRYGEWGAFGGYIYIAPNSGSNIDNTAVDGKAVKMIKNGQLVIIKGDKIYNAVGTQIR